MSASLGNRRALNGPEFETKQAVSSAGLGHDEKASLKKHLAAVLCVACRTRVGIWQPIDRFLADVRRIALGFGD